MQNAQQINAQLIQGGLIDAEMAMDIIFAKNPTQLKRRMNKAIAAKKAENNMIEQLQQQVQQYESDAKQAQKTISDLQNEIQRLNSQVNNAAQAKIQNDSRKLDIEEQEVRDKAEYNKGVLEVKNKQLEAEILQIRDGNPYNDQIRDV